jgi:hypothetical protein
MALDADGQGLSCLRQSSNSDLWRLKRVGLTRSRDADEREGWKPRAKGGNRTESNRPRVLLGIRLLLGWRVRICSR